MRPGEAAAGLAEAMGGAMASEAQIERLADAEAFHAHEMMRDGAAENDRAWLRWIADAERLAGHHLDGDQAADGYSLDFAYDAWERGETAAAHVATFRPELLR